LFIPKAEFRISGKKGTKENEKECIAGKAAVLSARNFSPIGTLQVMSTSYDGCFRCSERKAVESGQW
jgi:hypothetical protein